MFPRDIDPTGGNPKCICCHHSWSKECATKHWSWRGVPVVLSAKTSLLFSSSSSFCSPTSHSFLPFLPLALCPSSPSFIPRRRRRRKKANKKLPLFPLPFFAATHYVEWRRLGIFGSWCVVFVHVVFLFFHLLPFFGLNKYFVVYRAVEKGFSKAFEVEWLISEFSFTWLP